MSQPVLQSTVDNAELVLRGAQILHHWARGSDSRVHGDSQACRQERDTMAYRSVRSEVLIFSGLGIWLLLCPLGSVST